jgi:protein-disulfide isomerase
VEPVDPHVDHLRGNSTGAVILEYGDYECPYSRMAYRQIQRVETRLAAGVAFVFRHFPLTEIHPHALAAARAAEAAALQVRFWEMHDLLFRRQKALEDDDLRAYAAKLGLELDRFDADRASHPVGSRIEREIESGLATGQVRGTPTIFINGALHDGSYDAEELLAALR